MKKYKHRKSFTFEGKRYTVRADTEVELGKKMATKIADLEARKKRESNISVRDWAIKCIEIYKTNQSEMTRKKYMQRVNHCILEPIGHMKMKEVTPIICQEVINLQNGKSRTQINEVYQALKFIFSYAVYNEIIHKDPTLTLIKPKGTHKPRRSLTNTERDIFLKLAPTERRYYCFLLMYYCGCRPAEACECKGEDLLIIHDQPMLHIRGTKTKNADRYVPIPEPLWELINETPDEEYISMYSNGNQITYDNRKRVWDTLWKRMNVEAGTLFDGKNLYEPYLIPRELSPYCLRHDYCTRLAKDQIDLRIAQRLMGHSDIKLTANVYTHVDDMDVINAFRKERSK